MKSVLFSVLIVLFICSISSGQKPTKWRGPEANGIYPDTDLLEEWPANGPQINWHYDELGEGFSSPVFKDEKIYLTGMEGSEGFVYVLSEKGLLQNKFSYGTEFSQSYPGSRSSPTIVGDFLYMLSGHGKLVCMLTTSGEILWSKDLFKDFDGENITWGVTETVVVDGDKVFCTPGGSKNNVIALNRFSGKLIWSCSGEGDISAYCTPLLIELPTIKILVTMTANNIIGIDAASGQKMWSHVQTNRWSVHANTPIYHEGGLFCFSGYGKGSVKLSLSEDGSRIRKEWENASFDPRFGGAVLLNGHVYGSGDKNRAWQCIDWQSGIQKHNATLIGKGAVISADGMLYAYSERGELALMEPTPTEFKLLGKTKVTKGSAQHWAHPVIHKGVLYIRHGNALIAYNIAK
jgi:outer membrane protein assembly factor BamB